ncbi:hypothetical protein C8J55DRAFT_515203 [Lentinula edodes]|uniref:Uncharacterized protein n=1 Tax=Lentinula lateritia TaxID=40482 RepID=A0A9W9AAQ3_9AGAR|nr:hypothetical protein C8J55DRAFT_515203 [Lentinula edodes]
MGQEDLQQRRSGVGDVSVARSSFHPSTVPGTGIIWNGRSTFNSWTPSRQPERLKFPRSSSLQPVAEHYKPTSITRRMYISPAFRLAV